MKRIFALISFTFIFCNCIGQQKKSPLPQTFRFDFGSGNVQQGYLKVTPATMYSLQKGYGFDFNSTVTSKNYPGSDALRDDYITSNKPFYFSVKLPEGNYNVKVVVGDKEGTSVTTIKAENRRLMVEKVATKMGQFQSVIFTVHIRDSLINGSHPGVHLKPREAAYLHWDDKLTLEFNNSAPKICAVEISPNNIATTIFLAGNSTVVDQAEEPWASWGQMFPAFLKPKIVAVANYAESGETLKAFRREKRLEKIESMAKPGDYLFIEFAHNDQKPGGNHLDAFTTYKQTLKEWIAEARQRKIIPVLVTSTNRRVFDSTGHIINTLEGFPEAMRQTAKEEDVALIDLNAMSKTLYEAWGPELSKKAFVHYPAHTFPHQDKELKDNTHFNSYGAYELAKCVVYAIRTSDLPLKNFLKENIPSFNPAQPDPINSFHLPSSSFVSMEKPAGN